MSSKKVLSFSRLACLAFMQCLVNKRQTKTSHPLTTREVILKPQLKLFVPLATAVLVLDQVTKAVVGGTLRMHEIRPIIDGFLNFTRVHNTGAAFGLLAGQASPVRTFFFLAVSLLAMGVVLWMLFRLPPGQNVELVALSLIFGGALGNVFDRARLGEVIDFIDVYYKSYHWPAFNVADSAITVGVLLLVYRVLFVKQKS
jgi:signal peptidase II